MNVFDDSILKIQDILKDENIIPCSDNVNTLKLSDKNCFLMEKETGIELGGYPKNSINIVTASSNLKNLINLKEGVYCIQERENLLETEKHISFGKIVLLECDAIEDDKLYDFTQQELLTDSRLHIEGLMARQSMAHYELNLRVSKKLLESGFSLDCLGKSIVENFKKMDEVKSVYVIFLIGESKTYKPLLEAGQRIKDISLTLNHIFDGIDMDCGVCAMSSICDEVTNLRALHKRNKK